MFAFILSFVVSIIMIFWQSFGFMLLWNEFIPQAFNLQVLSMFEAVSAIMVLSFILSKAAKREVTPEELVYKTIGGVVSVPVYLLLAQIVLLFY